MESQIYDNIRKFSATSLSRLRGKYVRVQLIKDQSRNGFLYAIDPEDYSIVLLEETETILLPGHAVLGVSEIDPQPNVEPPPFSNTYRTDTNNLLEKKLRLLSWFRRNLIPMTEDGENLVFGNATIMPPYTVSCIYSPNLSVVTQVRKVIESMPENFENWVDD